MTDLLAASRLSRYYGRHCAVKEVGFNLAAGQVMGLLGVNGAGKTTTLQMLTGNLAPSSGQIRINGFDLLKEPISAKRHLGYLPDTPPLYKELTVREFLGFCCQLHGLGKQASKQAIGCVIDRCGLAPVEKRLLANLSKGYQQRVGIAQAIVHNPEVIILDEPTVGLDPLQIREIRSLIRELGQQHSIVLSTHILAEVAESCSHVLIIHQGEMVLTDSVANITNRSGTGFLLVMTALPVDAAVLLAIPGVVSVEKLTDRQLKIQHALADNPSQRISEAITAAGWELKELTPLQPSIEDVFIRLTAGKAS